MAPKWVLQDIVANGGYYVKSISNNEYSSCVVTCNLRSCSYKHTFNFGSSQNPNTVYFWNENL